MVDLSLEGEDWGLEGVVFGESKEKFEVTALCCISRALIEVEHVVELTAYGDWSGPSMRIFHLYRSDSSTS